MLLASSVQALDFKPIFAILYDEIKPHSLTYTYEWNDLYEQGFVFEVAMSENAIAKGWNAKLGLWFPHASPEGGNDTIAFGHKLLDHEIEYFSKGITMRQAYQLLIADIEKSLNRIQINAMDWNTLSWQQKWLLLDFQFNLGNVVKKFPKFTKAVLQNNKTEMLKQYKRYYRDSKGNLHEVKDRNERTYKFITQNF